MEQNNVICKVSVPTEFVNPIVLVKKSNNLITICLDLKNLNKALIKEQYDLPTFEKITHEIVSKKYFSVLDANKGFWQIKLTNAASMKTTLATPFGRYRFLTLPFGVSNAPEIFQRTFTDVFRGIKGIKIYIDDIIIYAKEIQEHNKILSKVLERAVEKGLDLTKTNANFA